MKSITNTVLLWQMYAGCPRPASPEKMEYLGKCDNCISWLNFLNIQLTSCIREFVNKIPTM